MKKVFVGMALGAAVLSLQAAPTPQPESSVGVASGKGTIRFGQDESGVGLFDFEVVSKSEIKGRVLFAGENHDHYPDVIVRMEAPENATFTGRSAKFTGTGMFLDEQVHVMMMVWDGSGTGDPDWLHVHVTNEAGEVLVHAQGDVFVGDIVVGHEN